MACSALKAAFGSRLTGVPPVFPSPLFALVLFLPFAVQPPVEAASSLGAVGLGGVTASAMQPFEAVAPEAFSTAGRSR